MLGKPEEMALVLGRQASFEGNLRFKGIARLHGNFEGEILSGDELIVGEGAIINAKIKAGTIIVMGQVNGNVSATVRIEILPTGKLYGNIDTPVLAIGEGGVLDGTCSMTKGRERGTKMVTPTPKVPEK